MGEQAVVFSVSKVSLLTLTADFRRAVFRHSDSEVGVREFQVLESLSLVEFNFKADGFEFHR